MKDEIEAWDRGYKIALELNIDIDKIEYDKISSYYLFEYIKWIPCEYDYLRSN